jgi:hypothetical protein
LIQAAHYVAIVPNRSSRPATLLRESYRDGAKVKNRTLANRSDWPAERKGIGGIATLERKAGAMQITAPCDVRRRRFTHLLESLFGKIC